MPTSKPKGLEKIWREVKRPFRKLLRRVRRGPAAINTQLNDIVNALEQQRQEIVALQEKITKIPDDININGSIAHVLSVYNLHQQVFPKYKNIHQGKEVVIVATGPSLKDYIPIENAIHIGVNRAFQFDKIKLDYYFLHDYGGFTPSYFQDAMDYKGNNVRKFFGILKFRFPELFIPESKAIEAETERYYLNQMWETEIPYDISTTAFPEYGSVVFHALLFALYTNPAKIYLVGCDCNLSGYFDNNEKNWLDMNFVLNGWRKFKQYAQSYYPDTQIISINPVGLKGYFFDTYTNERFANA